MRSEEQALNHCVQCRLLANPARKKRFKHYTQTTCSALLSDPFVTFEHDLPEKCPRALTQIHNQSTDTVKQWVFVSLQYTFRGEGTERKMENSWFVFVDITFGEFERTKSILKINYIFTVK